MGFDGSGNFTRGGGSSNWQNDAAAGRKIRADLHDTHDNELADALSLTILRDGRSQVIADIPFGNRKIKQLAPASDPTDAVNFGQITNIPDIHGFIEKTLPVDADELLLANSASSPAWLKARLTLLNLKTFIYNSFGVFAHAGAAKPVIVDADEFSVSDSVSTPTAWVLKRHSWLDLKKMIGINTDQRLAPKGSTALADANAMLETGWYFANQTTTANIPVAAHGVIEVFQQNDTAGAQSTRQDWHELSAAIAAVPLMPRSYTRWRWGSATWSAWVETTSADALLKKKDGVVVDAGYTQTPRVTPDAPSGGTYTPNPDGGNTRQVNSPGTAWTFVAPTKTGNYSMAVLINNPAISGAVTFGNFSKVTGGPHPTALGKWSLVYITKVGGVCTAFVEPSP